MNNDLERIYGPQADPSAGVWFANKDTKDSFVRYFDEFREIVHKREFGDEKGWVLSIGGPDKHFQVGNTFYPNARVAKWKADYRSQDELHYLELQVNKMRKSVTNDNNINMKDEIDYGF